MGHENEIKSLNNDFSWKPNFSSNAMIFSFIWHRKWLKWTTFEVCEPQRCAQKHEEQLWGHEIHRIYLKILILGHENEIKMIKSLNNHFSWKTNFFSNEMIFLLFDTEND